MTLKAASIEITQQLPCVRTRSMAPGTRAMGFEGRTADLKVRLKASRLGSSEIRIEAIDLATARSEFRASPTEFQPRSVESKKE
jgi:hypothetical protein